MNYLYLLKQLFNYETYLKYRHHIVLTKEDKEIYWLFKCLDDIFSSTNTSISFEDFALWVQVNLGNDYNIYLELIKKQESNEILIEQALQTIKERNQALKIAETALKVSEGKEDYQALLGAISSEDFITSTEESAFITASLKEIYDEQIKLPGLRWRLQCLNKSLGSLRKGDFGFIFARPETGKTTFLASEVTHFASQTKSPILWFNNEEQGSKVLFRCYQASLGLRREQLGLDLEQSEQLFTANTNNNILIYDSAAIHRKKVEELCKKHQPSCIIFDQLDKLKGFSDDRDDLRLGAIYIWARELAKTYAPVIGVSQSDASGEGKKYLNMDNVANAKTAKQAEADWILGIGKSNDNGFEYIRHLSISKNKLFGDEDSDVSLRHGKFDVLIQPEIARYKDL